MITVTSILTENGTLNADVFYKVFWDGLLHGISMCFDSPLKILLWTIILGLFILSIVLGRIANTRRIKRIARIQTEEQIRIIEEYEKSKSKSTSNLTRK